MFDRMTVQAEMDYRRERLSRSRSVMPRRVSRVRIPFLPVDDEPTGRPARSAR